jgi:rhodanese-related sulfurtransferase
MVAKTAALAKIAAFRRIDAAAARDISCRGNALVLDMRDADSFRREHIDGARLATKENFASFLVETPKETAILVYCHHGKSSEAVARRIVEQGFLDVASLDGGYEAWAAAERAKSSAEGGRSPPGVALSDALSAFLAQNGFARAEVDARDKEGATPLMLAARLAPPDLVKELLRAGADIDAVDANGNQALWLACVGEISDNIQLLIEAGSDVAHVNDNAATPLMFAASSGRAEAVALLLAAGADPLLETDLGLTALDMASSIACLNLMRDAVGRAKASAP